MTARGLFCASFLLAACGAPPSEGATSNAAGTGEAGGRALILDFPDGIRSRPGKIQGQARWSTDFTRDALLERINACGATDARLLDPWSHHLHAVSRSTPRDRDVVRCVMRTVPFDFNAGIGSDNPREFSHMDEAPFREFETVSGGTR